MPHSSASAGAIASVAFVRVSVCPFRGAASRKEREAVLNEWCDAFPNGYLVAPDSPDWIPVVAADMEDAWTSPAPVDTWFTLRRGVLRSVPG
ncbi:MAG: hypothetical protein JWM95_1690 [Gemmatimonadetes bacterium]|nr:hypothetical protein [Gemmatimonadota bacterium]